VGSTARFDTNSRPLVPVENAEGLATEKVTVAEALKQAGYATGMFGKWHLGYRKEFGPNAHGFDEFFGFLSGATDYYTHRGDLGGADLYEDTTAVETPTYLTDEITRRAVAFIDRDRADPFFLEVAYNAVHWPFEPPDLPQARRVQRRLYQGPADSVPATRHDYALMMERADRGIGEILRALDRRGFTRNTLVIFTNDNGGEWLSRNAPFFHRKGTLWEGGIRVPLIMRWPARLPAGRTSSQVAITMDLTASILAAAEVPRSPEHPLDGIDLVPILRGGTQVERDLYWRVVRPVRQQRAVRSGPWKLLVDGAAGTTGADGHLMLFDLRSDPGERNDLAAKYPERVRRMRALIAAWELDVGSRY
jgi:arylsulfatase A-like enzyme